jgi:elongator complex protein 2
MIWKSAIAKSKSETAVTSSEFESYPASEGVWQELRRLGETGEVNLPFLGVCLSQDESTLYAQSLRGAIHSWSVSKEPKRRDWWTASETITGHFDAVTDLAWERTGAYLLSSSNDKTCRLHAIAASDNKWHELARPQVHGYEVNCVASLNFTKFASGAEEKTIRTFEVTKFFIKNFKSLAKRQIPAYCCEDLKTALYDELPAHAQLPALGLSNRGSQCPFDVNEEDKTATVGSKIKSAAHSSAQQQLQSQTADDSGAASKLSDNNSWQEVSDLIHQLSTIDHLESLPHEEVLLLSTLWWEKNKLFGHCNELHAIACNSTGSFLASASKANRADLASVIVWDTDKFRKVATIEHHTLTITRIRFSPDDKYILSVSRDRTWCLCERNPNGQLRNAYGRLVGTVKANAVHERIIWDCCWTHDSKYFLTVSRDKKAILWSIESLRAQVIADDSQSTPELAKTMNLNYVTSNVFKSSIQAVDSTRTTVNDFPQYLFVLGFEDGSIELYNLNRNSSNPCADWQWQLLTIIPNLHQLSVRRLAFQPLRSDSGADDSTKPSTDEENLMLASGGDDCMVRLTRLSLSCVYPGGDAGSSSV